MNQRLAVAGFVLSAMAAALVVAPAVRAQASAPVAAPAVPASETLWVASRQTLPLLSQPQLGSPGVAAVTTGDALTVLGRQGDFVQLRTASGAIGWIRSALLTAESPAPPADLAADNARLAQQVTTLDAQVRAFQDESAQLRLRLAEVEAELALQTRTVPLTPAGVFGFIKRLVVEPTTWIALAALLIALLIAFRIGVAHRNESIRQRFGGLDL